MIENMRTLKMGKVIQRRNCIVNRVRYECKEVGMNCMTNC